VIDEGVALFPIRSELVFRDAKLNPRFGFVRGASSLITLGLRIAPDDATRGRFVELQAHLPTAAP
jgi:hypothetical protein